MKFYNNFSLKNYNTFGLDVRAKQFVEVLDEIELQSLFPAYSKSFLILGGGSNLLLTREIDGLVIKNKILGKTIIEDTEEQAVVAIGGGENWHKLVRWTIAQDLGGLENLSLIPGTVGAAPIQNIGAYGVELSQVFLKLEAVDIESGKVEVFDHKACAFGYRNSVFKKKYKGKFFITKVYLKLSKKHQLNLSYGAIQDTLKADKEWPPTIKSVSDAVIKIRQSKLPDPAQLGNSGSFFKNPEVSKSFFQTLQSKFSRIVFYPLDNGNVKIPAGWLIEQCGWKGKRIGNTGCYEKQALVLVNYGNATGLEIKEHAERVIHSVKEKFDITLTPEVNII